MCIRQAKVIGKLKTLSRVQAAVNGIPKNKHLAVFDKKDGTTYFVDTGADILVLSRRMVRGRLTPTDFQLFVVNNTTIKTYGSKPWVVNLGLQRLNGNLS